MNIAIRVDASVQLGSGHVMRCLTLAERLHRKGATVVFVCRDEEGSLCDFIASMNYVVHRLRTEDHLEVNVDAEQTINALQQDSPLDWLIVDHYGLDRRWETALRVIARQLMVIDDLADRQHGCDLLLDQNFYWNMESRYDRLVPYGCQKFLGPRHALLREEFNEARRTLRQRDGTIRSLLVFFGGADPDNETAKALIGLRQLHRDDLVTDVVVGSQNPHKEDIERICQTIPRTHFHCQVCNMVTLMAKADLAMGAGGATTWERCFLGLPSITVVTADNQLQTTLDIAQTGAIWYLGRSRDLCAEDYARAVAEAMADGEEMKRKSVVAMQLVNPDPDLLVGAITTYIAVRRVAPF